MGCHASKQTGTATKAPKVDTAPSQDAAPEKTLPTDSGSAEVKLSSSAGNAAPTGGVADQAVSAEKLEHLDPEQLRLFTKSMLEDAVEKGKLEGACVEAGDALANVVSPAARPAASAADSAANSGEGQGATAAVGKSGEQLQQPQQQQEQEQQQEEQKKQDGFEAEAPEVVTLIAAPSKDKDLDSAASMAARLVAAFPSSLNFLHCCASNNSAMLEVEVTELDISKS